MDKHRDTPGAVNGHVPIYTPIHKGLRSSLFKMSMKAGRMDYADPSTLNTFYDELNSVRANIRLHADLEEKFIHPLLSARVPGGAEKLEEAHHSIHHMFDGLVSHFDGIRSKSNKSVKYQELGLEFYLAFNRFIASLLGHIDDEEERVMPTLWNLCTAEELNSTWETLIASQKPDEAIENIEMIFAAANVGEIADMFTKIGAGAPPEVFRDVSNRAHRILDAHDWAKLETRIEGK